MNSKEKILQAIKQNPNATYAELARVCDMSQTNVYHHVSKLIESGKLRYGFKWQTEFGSMFCEATPKD